MEGNNAVVVNPLAGPLSGSVRVPGDKSISHRAILLSAMAEGTSRVSGVLDSEDVRASVAAARALGARVDLRTAEDGSLEGTVAGWGASGPVQPEKAIDCGNSGTTARLLLGMLAAWDISVEITGDGSLRRRPMRRITAPLAMMGARFSPEDRDTLPLVVCGSRALKPLVYDSPVASAQLKSAILLAGAFAQGTTVVNEPAPSRNHTELMLPGFGVPVAASECVASVTGPASLRACDIAVPGDPSSAAFLVCAAVLCPGSSIVVENVSLNPARTGFVSVLMRMGADIEIKRCGQQGEEPFGSIVVRHAAEHLRGCEVSARHFASIVDEIPVLALVASRAHGVTVFRGVGELRVKETDRLAAIIEGLGSLGVDAWEEDDCLFIAGEPRKSMPSGLVFDSRGDHRLAMTWALVGLCGSESVTVDHFDAVAVSYPGFLTDMKRLGR